MARLRQGVRQSTRWPLPKCRRPFSRTGQSATANGAKSRRSTTTAWSTSLSVWSMVTAIFNIRVCRGQKARYTTSCRPMSQGQIQIPRSISWDSKSNRIISEKVSKTWWNSWRLMFLKSTISAKTTLNSYENTFSSKFWTSRKSLKVWKIRFEISRAIHHS